LRKPSDITPELLEKCIQNNRQATQILYEYCFRIFMPLCVRYHKNSEDARSSYNLAFIKILNNLKAAIVKGDFNFIPWAKRIILNTLIDEYRKQQNYSKKIIRKANNSELEYNDIYFENSGEQEIAYELIMKLVSQLPELTSKIFNLYVVEGYSHKEIADLLNITEGNSKWHLSTGRKIMREKLEKIEIINETKFKIAL
jgi:RNA polymerase sigma-70 factor (ECF subfamily)